MKRLVVIAGLVAALFVISCNGEKPAPPPAGTATSTAVADDNRPKDGGTLLRRLDTDIGSLNPILSQSTYDRRVAHYLFTPMVYLDENLRPAPGLAESWKISDDGRTYTFELNEKATFADGKPVRPADVIFTLRKIVDPTSEAMQIASGFEQLDLSRTRATGEHTIEIGFKEALASQMIRFADLIVLPEHVYGAGAFRDDYNNTAVGSGPYKLVRRVPGKEVVIERRADYWSDRPHIQTVVFKVVGDHNTAWQAIKRGELDETIIPSDIWLRESKRSENANIEFRRFYTLNYNYIAWNGKDPLTGDKRVRQALARCVNLQSLITDLYHGTARAVTGHFTPEEWAYNPRVPVIQHNPEEARRMLELAGWRDTNGDGILDKNGKPFKLELMITAGSAPGVAFAQLFQADCKRIGADVEILTLEGTTAIQRILSGNYQAAYLAWELDPDPDPFAIFHSSQFPPRGQNFVYYSNPEADRLIEQGRRELDQDKRVAIYHRLHEVMAEDQPYTWTIQVSLKWALNKRLKGVRESRGNGLLLWYPGELGWWLADQK